MLMYVMESFRHSSLSTLITRTVSNFSLGDHKARWTVSYDCDKLLQEMKFYVTSGEDSWVMSKGII